ncbi:unnamed protein product [Amaranthus hypochondriacus]
MDTPQKTQIETPLSAPEDAPFDSPFFNFASNLSPINPITTIHVSQTIASCSFSSPPSVFTSPHVNIPKGCQLFRPRVLDLAKRTFVVNEGDKDSAAADITRNDHQIDSLVNVQLRGEGASGSENSCKAIEDSSECATEPPKEPSGRDSFETELKSQVVNNENEETSCDWQSLIDNNSDLFVFNSPNDVASSNGPLRKSQHEEANVSASLLARFPTDQAYGQSSLHVDSCSYNDSLENIEHSTQPTGAAEPRQIDETTKNMEISSVNEFLSGDSRENPKIESLNNLQKGMRRRCLTFEMPRSKKNADSVLSSGSLSALQREEKPLSNNSQPITPRVDSSRRIFPSIGLHLNALAAASKDCGISNQEMVSPTMQDLLMNSSDLLSLTKEEGPDENRIENAENSSEASVYLTNEDLYSNSPKKKRKKSETTGEGAACKRCNCVKSKCLKLYCECFAAGVYCIEPCSCQGCFNKPIHEDVVLATRKQIESRNALAFAPKVIRTTDSAQEVGVDSTQTPASARHKRGCNCKKSNCLKKYCECYQGGVGCSINCRCEGCKNAFGRRDGSTLLSTEVEMEKLQASERSIAIMHKTSEIPSFHNDDDQSSEFSIPVTPSKLHRPLIPQTTSSKGKPPRSSLGTMGSSSGLPRPTFLRSHSSTEKHCQSASVDEIPAILQNSSPPSSALKSLSPNSKRVSSPRNVNGHRSSRKLILQSIPSFPSL